MNNRTHRKLLVVDGRIGFTGGVGIGDEWAGDAEDPEHWRDSHYRLEGPAVAQMQAAFMDNWIKTTGRVLQGDEYFPALEAVGDGAGAGVHELADRRRRQHAADVPALDHRGRADDRSCRPRTSCRTSSRARRCSAALEARREGADHRARRVHRFDGRAQGLARATGANCCRPAPRSTSTSRRCSTARC